MYVGGYGSNVTTQLNDKLADYNPLGDNVIIVGPGMKYSNVQDAITAAVAAGAAYDKHYQIVPLPGAVLEWDEPLPAGVSVDYTPKSLTPVPVAWNAPLITIMADDCLADWTTPEVELGNISPLQYAANYGVPINLGLIGKDYADTAKVPAIRVSMADLNTFCRQNLALYAHSWTHANPADQQGVLRETLGVRQLIDSLHAASIGTAGEVNQYIGTRCMDYWKQPGDMTGDNLIDGLAKLHKTMARTVRKYYGASGAYHGISSQQKPHFGTVHFTGAAAVTATASVPSSNIMIFTHGLDNYPSDLTVAQFKSIIDNIVTLRAAGQAYPVTVETWFAAVMCGATGVTDTTRASVWRNLNCVTGCVDELADGAVSTTFKSNGWYSSGVGASVVDLGGGEKCLQIDNVGGATCTLNHTLALEPGRKYSLSFLARRIPLGGAGHQFRVLLNTPYMSVAGVSTNNIVTLRTSTLPDADDWVRYWYTFEVPWWSTVPAIWIASPSGKATKLQVRDILLARQ